MGKVSDGRGKRPKSEPLSPDEIREKYYNPLAQLAFRLDRVCAQMNELGVDTLTPRPWGIDRDIASLEEIIEREFEDRLKKETRRVAREAARLAKVEAEKKREK